jgi:hypothetical protein
LWFVAHTAAAVLAKSIHHCSVRRERERKKRLLSPDETSFVVD